MSPIARWEARAIVGPPVQLRVEHRLSGERDADLSLGDVDVLADAGGLAGMQCRE
jgi:hypothetical protein